MGKGTELGLKTLQKMKGKIIIAGIIVVALLGVIVIIFYKGYVSAQEKSEQKIEELMAEVERLSDEAAVYEELSKEVVVGLINTEIKQIGELATVEYLYTDAAKYTDPKQLFGVDIPFTTKSLIVKWDGSIKAGVKMDEITVEVKKDIKEIVIQMPKAEILSHEIENNSFETLDEKNGLFNPIKVDDVRQLDAESQVHMENRAIENGLLDKALENAKDIVYRLVNTDMVVEQGYKIIFKVME